MMRAWPKHVVSVMGALHAAGHEAYLVGGCVRDSILGRTIHDFDVATSAHPSDVLTIFPRTIPTGLKHGTVTVLSDNYPIEVTTYRIDKPYSDGRRPDSVQFTQRIEEDLARRDFTINAMALSLHGNLIDPFGGQTDCLTHVIRAVGDAHQRFHEDGLRILRALRFGAQLSFQIAPNTYAAMTDQAYRLSNVSRERIGQEWSKIASHSWGSILTYLATGPFLDVMPGPFHNLRGAFSTLLTRQPEVESVDERLCAFSSAAPGASDGLNTRRLASSALWTFLAQQPPAQAAALARAIAWPRQWGLQMQQTVEWLYRDPGRFSALQWRTALYEGSPLCVQVACTVLDILNGEAQRNGNRLQAWGKAMEAQPIFSRADLALTGYDLMEIGFLGRDIGAVERTLVAEVLEGGLPNQYDILVARAMEYRQHAVEAKGESE
jgi:tRNA nucleotidyltransferase (CCA-adding enzyme)